LVRYGSEGVPEATGVALDNAYFDFEGERLSEASHIRFVEDVLQIRLRHSIRVP
jgi:hypothetical protein